MRVLVWNTAGHWRQVSSHVSGNYLVFAVPPEDDGFCLLGLAPNYGLLMALAGGAGDVPKETKKRPHSPKESDPSETET